MNVTANNATARLIADNPDLAALLAPRYAEVTGFMADMRDALKRGRMSDRQIAAAVKAIARDAQRDAQRAQWQEEAVQLAASGVTVPTGRVAVAGEILSARYRDTMYGVTIKVTLKADAGYKLWGTLPSALEPDGDLDLVIGRHIAFTATLEPSERDQTFGFYKRPSKATFTDDAPEDTDPHDVW